MITHEKLLRHFLSMTLFVTIFSLLAACKTLSNPSSSFKDEEASGIEWPADRIFPQFQEVRTLDVLDRGLLDNDTSLTAAALEGIVNRSKPRIYLIEGFSAEQKLWLAETGATTTNAASFLDLLTKYKDEVKGLVIYDDKVPDTINLATTIAGQTDSLPVSAKFAETLSSAPYSFKVIKDLRDNNFQNKIDVYQYMLDNYTAAASKRILFGLTPDIRGFLRDYIVATKGAVIFLNAAGGDEEVALRAKFMAQMEPASPYLGWGPDEGDFIGSAAKFQMSGFAADFSSNLSVLGAKQELKAAKADTTALPKLENKIYVSIFMSDGDNIQLSQGLIPALWNNPERGKIPLAWTLSPALVDLAPVILNYFRRTATDNDVLVSGPSGVGYSYPRLWPTGTLNKYTKLSAKYLDRAGFNIITIWNGGDVALSDEVLNAYASDIPNLLGMTTMYAEKQYVYLNNSTPVQSFSLSYGDTPDICSYGIEEALKRFDGSKPMFVSLQANINLRNNDPATLGEMAKRYAGNNNIVFVRADQYFHLIKMAKP